MDRQGVRAAYDEQIRQRPEPDGANGRVERSDGVVRVVSSGDGWSGVTWSDLAPDGPTGIGGTGIDGTGIDAVIAAQVERFAAANRTWEWKHYSYDRPDDLPARLIAAGLTPEPPEALMVAEIATLDLDVAVPAGVRLRPVTNATDVDALVRVHDEVFGIRHAPLGRVLADRLARRPSGVAAIVAWAGTVPISAARVEFHDGTAFASMWGGGTLPPWRGRGVFRALVAWRAALAAERGFEYLQVDASNDSRPILARLGFVELATTTPFLHSA